MGTQIAYPNISFIIKKGDIPLHHLLFELCTGIYFYLFSIYSSVKKGVPVSVFPFFFITNSPFFIFTSKNSSQFGGKYLCRLFINRGSV